jgi:DNA mismatch repair ATPase MutS
LESKNGVSFSQTIGELNRIIGAMGLRQNVILYAIVHAFAPWDFYWTARAEKLRLKLETVYLRWIEDLVEFEAIALLAEYSQNIQNGVWPKILSENAQLVAKDLRHPLIPARYVVANDVDLDPTHKKCLLLTGSNMSGKSTFLRTLGINLILMRIGSRVHAQRFESSALQVLTSLKRVDSLEESLSTFYSEVKNLKEIRDECISHPSIYLIDEIFRGTNNRERLIGAQKYIKALLQSPSIGLVTTHDLELSQMDQEYKNLVNEHFADRIENGKMIFDYKKKSGPCPSTNALKVMEMEGVF